MSFSYDVKKEIACAEAGECCGRAESYGLLLFGKSFNAANISITTEHGTVAEKYASVISGITGRAPQATMSKSGKCTLSVEDKEDRERVLSEFSHEGKAVGLRINRANLIDDSCPAAFVRGAFFACGSVADPEKEYHLEFSIPFRNLCLDFMKIFDEFDELSPKMSLRGGTYIVYFKDSAQIEDVLAIMGAMSSSLELMNIKIFKDVRNNVNRKVNFENANIDRSVNASFVQIEAIKKIASSRRGLEALPEELRRLALLRLENPEMSLSELGRALPEPISRSGVNHRLSKIIRISEEVGDR